MDKLNLDVKKKALLAPDNLWCSDRPQLLLLRCKSKHDLNMSWFCINVKSVRRSQMDRVTDCDDPRVGGSNLSSGL